MHDNETDRFADQLLNVSLAGYAAEEPRAGLEQRILARLAEQPQPPAWWAWRWLPAGALALVALLALALFVPRRETAPPQATITSQPPKVAPSERPAPDSSAPAVATNQRAPRQPRPATPATLAPARAAQFPRPGSLTEEERLLMSYLETAPREVLVAAARSQEPMLDVLVRDVEVPKLELEPLPEQSAEPTIN
jgi:hypothetical protein